MDTKKAASGQCANTDPTPNTTRYPGASDVPAEQHTDATPNELTDPAAAPVKTPRRVKWVASIGIPVSLAAAAAVSFAGLTELGGFAGIDHPWLMPVAIDVYATTSTLIAMLLPEGHHARATAVWHARLGLAMSMGGNATARALYLGASGSVATLSGALLTFVGAWPSLIVERLLQLQGRLVVGDDAGPQSAADADDGADGASTVPDDTPALTVYTDKRQTAATDNTPQPATDKPRPSRQRPTVKATVKATDNNTVNPGGEQPTTERWVEIGKPVYEEIKRTTGKRPTEGPFAEALAAEVARLIAAGRLSTVYANPSPSTAKRIRGEVETKFPHLAPLRPVPDDTERAAS